MRHFPRTLAPQSSDARRRRATALLLSPVVASTALLAIASPANAAVPGPGAVADINGSSFPAYYQDATGLQLRPCLNALHCAATTAADVVNPDGEFFYNLVEGDVGPFLAVIGLEGAYIDAGVGQEMVFNRLRFRARPGTVEPNTDYTIVHPYGVSHVRSVGDGSARVTDDDGCEV